jgi:spore protease
MFSVRTDLAIEAREIYEQTNKSKIPGVRIENKVDGEIKITEVVVETSEGEIALGKPIGTYVTLEMPEFTHYDADTMDEVSVALGKLITPLIKQNDSLTTLVVGLGNWNVTPDSLGPKVVSKILVTRHLKQLIPDQIDEGIRPVCAIAPGVLGLTGIETSEIIKGIVEKIKPNLVICIDALASRRADKVNRTIQIGTSGISPGSGVGNKRMEISEKTLGVPVIAIGVPTVVDAATLANDTIDLVLDEMVKQAKSGGEFYNILKSIDKDEKLRLIKQILSPQMGNLMVTPKEVDLVIDSVSKVIANGINIALQDALGLEDINRYLN